MEDQSTERPDEEGDVEAHAFKGPNTPPPRNANDEGDKDDVEAHAFKGPNTPPPRN